MPKIETQSLEFICANPTYDGRGVIVGILDTGVDPGSIGLNNKTSDGKQKVIDIIDCSGSGDVKMSSYMKCIYEDDISYITTCDYRKIILNKNWINPSGLFRHGIKRAYDLYPKLLQKRVKSERKKQSGNLYIYINISI